MFLEQEFRPHGEPPRPQENPSSKGYPLRRDPQAESPQGIMNADLSDAAIRRMREKHTNGLEL